MLSVWVKLVLCLSNTYYQQMETFPYSFTFANIYFHNSKHCFTEPQYQTSTRKVIQEDRSKDESLETLQCEDCPDETTIYAVLGSLVAAILVIMVVNGVLYFRSRGFCTFQSRDFEKMETGSQSSKQNDESTIIKNNDKGKKSVSFKA